MRGAWIPAPCRARAPCALCRPPQPRPSCKAAAGAALTPSHPRPTPPRSGELARSQQQAGSLSSDPSQQLSASPSTAALRKSMSQARLSYMQVG